MREFRQILASPPTDYLANLYIARVQSARTSLAIWTAKQQHTQDVIRHALLPSAPAQDERLFSARGQVQQCKQEAASKPNYRLTNLSALSLNISSCMATITARSQ